MEPIQDYFSLPSYKGVDPASLWYDWSQQLSPWETTPNGETPIWQSTVAAVDQRGSSMSHYTSNSPISPFENPASSPSSTVSHSNIAWHPTEARFSSPRHLYGQPSLRLDRTSVQPPQARQNFEGVIENDDMVEDEDSDGCSLEVNQSSTAPASSLSRPSHRRTKSANEASRKIAKRTHTAVERNYRERLNDKIGELALYLFETSSDSPSRPSKSLVMTRAKERLKQFEARNKSLEEEVTKLRQHIAILDHIVASKKEESIRLPTPC